MRALLALLLACSLCSVMVAAQAPAPFAARLDELRVRIDQRAFEDADALSASLRDDAAQAGDQDTVAAVLRAIVSMRLDQDRVSDALTVAAEAQAHARAHGLRRRELEATLMLSRARAVQGGAREVAGEAIAAVDGLTQMDVPRETLLWAFNQVLSVLPGLPEHAAMLERVRPLLRADDRFPVACSLWHSNGDAFFNQARYVEAHEALSIALTCYEGVDDRADAGRVLVSLGRVQRAHGQLPAALEYYRRAAAQQEAVGDYPGLIQSLNAQAVTYDRLGRFTTSERLYRRALTLSQQRKLERYEVFIQGNLGGSLLNAGHMAAGLRELQAVLPRERSPFLRATRLRQISEAWRELGDYDKALAALDDAHKESPSPSFDERVSWLTAHARVLARRGDLDLAQRDLDEALRMVEQARAGTFTADQARRGFGELHQGLFAVSIEVAMRRQEPKIALELAEQARARALLDLMREGRDGSADAPPRIAEMQAVAREHGSTLLVYWVDDAAVLAWVVTPDAVHGHRLAVSARSLRQLVRVAAGSGNVPAAINAAMMGGPNLQAWRSLYRAVIAPLEPHLPARPAARLTIVPHGALLHLPFAGLLDARGRHLVERYVLHYTPSIAVLQAAARQPTRDGQSRALILGDPAPLPRLAGVQLPPPLPNARVEARRVARSFPQGALLSIGGAATERTLREAMGRFDWLHVATHARVAEEDTASSYLLLARGAGGATDDGLLTADEVRALPLAGATVVLSACGTALGRVTGEGTLGFTRSFLAAGARSVVATTWEMPDLAGLRVMDGFYGARRDGRGGLSEALRAAQVAYLRALRAGKVTARVGGQVITLPATPLLWAGYIAVGIP
ncbi:CHAT domain-containing protein [Luteitalea sp.]